MRWLGAVNVWEKVSGNRLADYMGEKASFLLQAVQRGIAITQISIKTI
jgi:hypothetical protein